MAFQESTTLAGRPARKFTPANIQKIRDWVAEGISREEIAKSLGATVGSLQVTCSRLGISLRRRDLLGSKGPGRPRLVRTPSSPSAPSIVGQMQAGRPRFQITFECSGTRRTIELPLPTASAIGQLKLEADIRNSEHGPTSGGSCDHGDQKGDDRSDLREPAPERAPPLQAKDLVEPVLRPWVLQVLVQAHTRPALAQDACKSCLAHLDGLSAQVRPVQLQQVEGVEECLRLVPPMSKELEGGPPPPADSAASSHCPRG